MNPESIIVELLDDNQVRVNGVDLDLHLSLSIRNHSPSGFAWGYGGSGPAQLALAILMDVLPLKVALRHYMQFKASYVSQWPQDTGSHIVPIGEWIKTQTAV